MSFAGDVKTELCRGKLGDKGAAQAEACGVLLYCNRFTLDQVKIVTESPAFAKRLPGLFRKAFGLTFDEKGDPGTPGKRIFTIGDRPSWPCCGRCAPSTPATPPTTSTSASWRMARAGWPFSGGPSWPGAR